MHKIRISWTRNLFVLGAHWYYVILCNLIHVVIDYVNLVFILKISKFHYQNEISYTYNSIILRTLVKCIQCQIETPTSQVTYHFWNSLIDWVLFSGNAWSSFPNWYAITTYHMLSLQLDWYLKKLSSNIYLFDLILWVPLLFLFQRSILINLIQIQNAIIAMNNSTRSINSINIKHLNVKRSLSTVYW
jgi:hypothetical protein